MSKDNVYELGQLHRDPTINYRPADAFRTQEPRPEPTTEELALKAIQSHIDGYDPYGVWDGKMRMGTNAGSIRRVEMMPKQNFKKGG